MTKVFIVVGKISEAALTEALTQFQARGADVSVVCNFDTSTILIDPALGKLHQLPQSFGELGKAASNSKGPRRVWFKVRDDHWARKHARHADMIVALDQDSIYAVWELAQRYRRSAAIYGIAPALKILDRGLGTYSASRVTGMARAIPAASGIAIRGVRNSGIAAAKTAAKAVISPAVMRARVGSALWSRAVTLPSIPDPVRGRMIYHVHKNMVQAGMPTNAARVVNKATRQMKDKRRKADLLASASRIEAQDGSLATYERAIAAELAIADDFFEAKAFRKAAVSLRKAMGLVFLRTLHYDRVEVSPLIDAPEEFMAAWWRSSAVHALSTPRGRNTPAVPAPSDRPMRLLIATSGNDNFLTEIRSRYQNMPGVETRFLNFRDDKRRYPLATDPERMAESIMSGGGAYAASVEEWLAPHIEWADTVFIDWCAAGAVMFSLVDPGTTRIIVRLHSYETFSYWPQMVDFSRIDDLVFVSEHLRDVTKVVLPQLAASPTRLHVISNAMDLLEYPRDKAPDARFTLGLVGIGSVAKDPRWALEVLRLLRQRDERYRIMLFGETREADVSTSARRYYDLFGEDLAELEPSGAATRLGHVDDVRGALTKVGVILSTSVRESFHCGLVEGAASGAVPIVRNWPFFAKMTHGAHTLFPADWVVETPEQAAERIWALTQSEEQWRTSGREASELAIKEWDWTVTQRAFDELFLGADEDPTSGVPRRAL